MKAFAFLLAASLLLAGCSNTEPAVLSLDDLARVDIQETMAETSRDIILVEDADINTVKDAFSHIEWSPNAMVDLQAEQTIQVTLFYEYDKNMPERLAAYDVYLMPEGSLSFQSDQLEQEGYGELHGPLAEKLKTVLFESE